MNSQIQLSLTVMKVKNFIKQLYYFKVRRTLISLNNIFIRKTEQQFLFILSAPFSGSTLLHKIISSSNNVSPLNISGNREGFGFPELQHIINFSKMWDENYYPDWNEIKEIWGRYIVKNREIILEKTPCHLIRVKQLKTQFPESLYITLIRNPYALAEGLMRRKKLTAQEAADCVIYYFKRIAINEQILTQNLVIKYEELSENPYQCIEKIQREIPKISKIKIQNSYKVHNIKGNPNKIENLNEIKINSLSFENKSIIKNAFLNEKNLLESFDYKLEYI